MFENMKNNYNQKYNEELKKTGLFWAFSREQFEENKTHKDAPDNEYLHFGSGGYIHKSNKKKLDDFFKVIAPKLKSDFVSKISIDDLIRYELVNHECYYTGDYSEVVDIIHSYYEMPINKINDKVKNIYEYEQKKNLADFGDRHVNI